MIRDVSRIVLPPSHDTHVGRVSDVHFTTRHAMRRPPAERERERIMPGFAPAVTPTRSCRAARPQCASATQPIGGTRAGTASDPCPCLHARIGMGMTVLGQGQRCYLVFLPFLTVSEIAQRAGRWCGTWPHGQTPVDTGWCANPMPATTSGRWARLLASVPAQA